MENNQNSNAFIKVKEILEERKLEPMCFKDFPWAITNEDVLLPCCYMDTPENLRHPTMQRLMAVSNLNDHESIEEILLQKEWVEFYKDLKRNVGPPACHYTCSAKLGTIRKDVFYDTETGEPEQEVLFGNKKYGEK